MLFLIPSMWAADRYRERWLGVADRVAGTSAEALKFDWGEGVQLIGMMKAFERTAKPAYADYVEKFAAFHLKRDRADLLAVGAQRQNGFCGRWSPATAILYLYEARKNPAHMEFAMHVGEFIAATAERSKDGALGHWIGSHQLWVDTLYMACPLQTRLGVLQKKPEWIRDAGRQIVLYAKPLQDPEAGLFYHMWDWQTGERTPALWGRGNGWVLMSIADVLESLPKKDPLYGKLVTIAKEMMAGLKKTQDAEGMWHTVMDDAKSYPEASATAMFVYGALKLMRLGALDSSQREMILRGWKALNEQYIRDGVVEGVSAGTMPNRTNYYKDLPRGTQTWGTGAYLMAGSEADRLK